MCAHPPSRSPGMNVAAGPELAAAVTNAGGLGVIGGVGYTPKVLRSQVRWCALRESHENSASLLRSTLAIVDSRNQEGAERQERPVRRGLAHPSSGRKCKEDKREFTSSPQESISSPISTLVCSVFYQSILIPSYVLLVFLSMITPRVNCQNLLMSSSKRRLPSSFAQSVYLPPKSSTNSTRPAFQL